MRVTALVAAVLTLACARELRSRNSDLWLELQTEHFTLRTDVPEEDARRDIADLELIRNALLAAGWHGKTTSPARIVVVAVASDRELHEFLADPVVGLASSGYFGDRMILVRGDGNLLDSEVVKHEVTHALLREYLLTNPRWVEEGIACLLETLEIKRSRGVAVRGSSTWQRRQWLRYGQPLWTDWFMHVMGMGAIVNDDNGYQFETQAWGLVHWLVDTQPASFDRFMAGLARGEGMWTGCLPDVAIDDPRSRFPLKPWAGSVMLRKIAPAEVHALRAELFARFATQPPQPCARASSRSPLAVARET